MTWTLFCIIVFLDMALIAGLVIRNVKLADDVAFWKRRALAPMQHWN
jgi:hypothetical protein